MAATDWAESAIEILKYSSLNDLKMADNTILGMQTLITNLDGMSDVYGTQIDGMRRFVFLSKRSSQNKLQEKPPQTVLIW